MVMAATPCVSPESSSARPGTLTRKLTAIPSHRFLVAAIAAVSTVVGPMATAASITPLLDSSVSGSYVTEGLAISGDGSTVAGFLRVIGGNTNSYTWQNGTPTDFGTSTGAVNPFNNLKVSLLEATNLTGSVVGGRQNDGTRNTGFVFNGGTQQLLPGPNPGNFAWVYGLTDDGQTVAGENRNPSNVSEGWTWNAGTGYTSLGTGVNVRGISGDGTIVVGRSGTNPARWINGAWEVLPMVNPAADLGLAFAISHDKSTIVGEENVNATGGRIALVWANNTVTPLLGSGFDYSYAMGVSGDGTAVIGTQGDNVNFADRAFLWTPDLGVVDLNVYLPTIGVDLTGWTLTRGWGISNDGTKIVGFGLLNGVTTGFVADISAVPEPATLSLAALGVAGAGLAFRRRQFARRTSQAAAS